MVDTDEQTRRRSAKVRVLDALRRGPQTNVDLNAICYRYGARIHELRAAGYVITRTPAGRGVFVYRVERREHQTALPLAGVR